MFGLLLVGGRLDGDGVVDAHVLVHDFAVCCRSCLRTWQHWANRLCYSPQSVMSTSPCLRPATRATLADLGMLEKHALDKATRSHASSFSEEEEGNVLKEFIDRPRGVMSSGSFCEEGEGEGNVLDDFTFRRGGWCVWQTCSEEEEVAVRGP